MKEFIQMAKQMIILEITFGLSLTVFILTFILR